MKPSERKIDEPKDPKEPKEVRWEKWLNICNRFGPYFLDMDLGYIIGFSLIHYVAVEGFIFGRPAMAVIQIAVSIFFYKVLYGAIERMIQRFAQETQVALQPAKCEWKPGMLIIAGMVIGVFGSLNDYTLQSLIGYLLEFLGQIPGYMFIAGLWSLFAMKPIMERP